MKLTRTSLFIAAWFLIMVTIEGCQAGKHNPALTPKDTPIVVGGGSIHGKADQMDTDGWTLITSQKLYSASLHASDNVNPYGIDYLTFNNFDNDPGYAITGTAGWAISIRNPDLVGVPKSISAVMFCSDQTCSASKKLIDGSDNPSRCKTSFNQNGPVYLQVRNDSQLIEVKTGAVTNELDFHDPSCTGGSCDKVYDVKFETCNGADTTFFTCQEDKTTHKQICAATVGKSQR